MKSTHLGSEEKKKQTVVPSFHKLFVVMTTGPLLQVICAKRAAIQSSYCLFLFQKQTIPKKCCLPVLLKPAHKKKVISERPIKSFTYWISRISIYVLMSEPMTYQYVCKYSKKLGFKPTSTFTYVFL